MKSQRPLLSFLIIAVSMISLLTVSPTVRSQIVTQTVTATTTTTVPQTYNLQVGAYGDSGSFSSLGVRAEIRLHTYPVTLLESDAFWVGTYLKGGAFIQFGYALDSPGIECNSGEVYVGSSFSCSVGERFVNGSGPLWFWEYFPETISDHFFYGQGQFGSSGINGSWHLYSIIPHSPGQWAFLLDGRQVASATFPTTNSASQVSLVAEKITGSTQPGPLGPVEFRSLAYLKQDGWHPVSALYAIVGCGGDNPSCIPIPYGVCLEGPNHFIAGTSVIQRADGQIIWDALAQSSEAGNCLSSPSFVTTIMAASPYLVVTIAVVELLILVAVFIRIHRRSSRSPQ